MPDSCAVYGCVMRRDRDKVRLFCLPVVRTYGRKTKQIEMTRQRRLAWIRALGKVDNGGRWKVCAKHFIGGEPAKAEDIINPDWAPCQNLDYSENNANRKRKIRRPKPAVPDELDDVPMKIEVLDEELLGSDVEQQFKCENTDMNGQFPQLNHICRLCLDENMDDSIYIHAPSQPSDVSISVAQCIENLINIKVSESDGLPPSICCTCFETLEAIQKFQHQSIKSYAKLQSMISDPKHPEQLLEMVIDLNVNAQAELKVEACVGNANPVIEEQIECIEQNVDAHPEFVDVTRIQKKACKSPTPLKHKLLRNDGISPTDQQVKTKIPKRNRNGQTLCTICGVLVWNHSLEQHANRHMGVKPYICSANGCEKAFVSRAYLESHYRDMHANNNYECDICGAIRSRKSALRNHMVTHFDGKRSCPICGRKFRFNRQVANHMMVHTNERPISCDLCSKKCRNKWQLLIHMRVHTKVRPYKCQQCDANFTYNYQLKVHTEKNHGLDTIAAPCYKFNEFFTEIPEVILN